MQNITNNIHSIDSRQSANRRTTASRKLAYRYHTACSNDLALALTFLRHPVAGRSKNLTRLDHSFSLPDGYVATIRSRRVRVPLPLAAQLKNIHPELQELHGAQLFLFGVVIRVSPPQPMIVSAEELTDNATVNGTPAHYDYARSRAIAEALHPQAAAQWIHDNGSDCAFGGFRFGWIGIHDAQPLPSPKELFIPRVEAA